MQQINYVLKTVLNATLCFLPFAMVTQNVYSNGGKCWCSSPAGSQILTVKPNGYDMRSEKKKCPQIEMLCASCGVQQNDYI